MRYYPYLQGPYILAGNRHINNDNILSLQSINQVREKHDRGVGSFYPRLQGRENQRKLHRGVEINLDLRNKESSSIKPRRRRSGRGMSWSRGLEASRTQRVQG